MANLKEVGTELRDAGAQAVQGAVQGVQAGVTEGVRHAAPGLEALARFGYASKGVVYGTIGLLALNLALGRSGQVTDSQGALTRIHDLPLGGLLIWLLVVGLLGYALWQLLRALLDPEEQGNGPKGLLKRAGYAVSGLTNFGVAYFAYRLATQAAVTAGGSTQKDLARQVLDWPGGQVLLGLAGLVMLVVGGVQVANAVSGKFMKRIALHDFAARHAETVRRVGQAGIAARGVVLGAVGVFLLLAAWKGSASGVRDTAGILNWLHDQGSALLAVVALGTLCYGAWCFVQALYRRIRIGD